MSTTIITPNPIEGGFQQTIPLQSNNPSAVRRQPRSVKNMWIASIATAAAVCLLLTVIFHAYVAWMLAYPYVAPLKSNPEKELGLAYEDVVFPSASGRTTISGWFIPSEADSRIEPGLSSKRTVVFSHGYGANREESWVPMYELANLMHGLDYNVLLFDYGYASTQYKAPATGGWEESQQLIAAVDYARGRGAEEVIVWGFSMGAGTALQAALQTDEIDAMILDSLFIPSSEALFDNLNQFIKLPSQSLRTIESLIPLWTGMSFGSIPTEEVVANVYDIPLYIIHGTSDVKAPVDTAEAVAADQGNPLSRSWIVANGQHEMIYRTYPKEYMQRAILFLSQVEQEMNERISG